MEVTIAEPTSSVPCSAKSLTPSALSRVIFSKTTIELSRITPSATTNPPSEKTFIEKPIPFINAKFARRVIGRATTITITCRNLPRKRYITIITKTAAINAEFFTLLIAPIT